MNEQGRKTWASPKERVRHYSKQYQDRLRAEGGEKYAEYLANRRATDAKLRAKRRAERQAELEKEMDSEAVSRRIRKMADDVRKARVAEQKRQFRAKVNKQIQQQGAAQDKRDQSRAHKAKIEGALSGQQASSDGETVEQFIARGGRVEVLKPGTWSAPLRFEY